jgi:hypothetical protein
MTSHRNSRIVAVLFLTSGVLALILLISAPAWAQVAGATLSGTVTDVSGAVIPEAQVSIKDVGTGVSRSVKTNVAGFYIAPNLLPGAYEITITAQGFSTEVRTGITLTVGAQQDLNLTLRVGATTETVKVSGEAPGVQLANSTLGNVVDANSIRELPLNGRDWTLLAALQPGISDASALQTPISNSSLRGNRGYGTQLTISGSRPEQNNYRIDGISVSDYSNGGPGSVLGSSLGVDAIQEFSVLSHNYSAEYGRTSGGVINAITRSGTNNFHGDVFEFLRNDALDAATSVENAGGLPKPAFRQNQFGGAAGGRIFKDRTFFFADYEGIRQSLGVSYLDVVPSADARNGIIHNANGTTCTIGVASPGCAVKNSAGTVGVDPLVKPFLALWPLPNGSVIAPGNTGNFSVSAQQAATENFVSGRIDHKISDKDNLFGSYQYDKGLLTAPDPLNYSVTGNNTIRQFVGLEETHMVTAQLVNNFRIGYNRSVSLNGYGVSAISPLEVDKSLSAVPGQNPPRIAVTGITQSFGGLNSTAQFRYYWNSLQGYDDVFLSRGKHELKLGIAVERIDLNSLGTQNTGGFFTFGSLTSFLTNQDQGVQFNAQLPGATSPRGERQTIVGAYLQDDVRWRPNLTLNLGVRYEMATVPTEVNGKLSNLYNATDSLPHCGMLVPGCVAVGPLWSNPTLRNFEPRVGFAWDPFHSGKTSVRGGFGIFDVLPLPYLTLIQLNQSAPFSQQGSVSTLPNGAFPTAAFNIIQGAPLLRTPHSDPNPPRSYVMQWNLNVQRELLPNLTAMVAYAGSHGVHIPFREDDMNYVLPTATPQGYLWPCPGGFSATGLCTKPGAGTVINPTTGQMDALLWTESSLYDDLELQITKRMSHGFQIQGAYTWGKAIDEGSSTIAGNTFQNSIQNPLFFDLRLSRAVADFNIAQKVVINYNWVLPEPRSLPAAAAWLLGGWQVGGIFTAHTGAPFTVNLGGDPLGLKSNKPSDFPNRLFGPGCESAVNPGSTTNYIKLQCFAFPNPSTLRGNEERNSLIGPALQDFDVSLIKNNHIKRISEGFNAQFRAEFFNVLNRANFAAPTDRATVFDQTGKPVGGAGQLDLLSTPARQIQFALKLIW